MSDERLLAEVSNFLALEARLLDEQKFEDWLALFDPKGRYWVPAAWGQTNALEHVSIYYEDIDLLRVRIMRLRHPRTETMRPPPRTVRTVTNPTIDRHDAQTLETRAAYLMVEYRLAQQRLFAGVCTHHLRREGAGFKMLLKRVDLLNCDTEAGHVRLTIPF